MFVVCALVGLSTLSYGQTSGQNPPSSPSSGAPPSGVDDDHGSKPTRTPDLSPPRSDRVNADELGNNVGESSSKDTQIDLSPPADDAKAHPISSDALTDVPGAASGASGVGEFHPWDPHKAAKDIEVGDYYFKRKNYIGAESRYREALVYKDNDAVAMYKLAVCLDKMTAAGPATTTTAAAAISAIVRPRLRTGR